MKKGERIGTLTLDRWDCIRAVRLFLSTGQVSLPQILHALCGVCSPKKRGFPDEKTRITQKNCTASFSDTMQTIHLVLILIRDI